MNNRSTTGGRNLLYSPTRQLELDIAKDFAVLCMIAVHVQSNLSQTKIIYSGFGGIVEFLGTLPAAPVFMFLLGMGAVYSRNNNLSKSIERGLKIFALGYILNFLRTIIIFSPLIVSGDWVSQLDKIIPSLSKSVKELLYLICPFILTIILKLYCNLLNPYVKIYV